MSFFRAMSDLQQCYSLVKKGGVTVELQERDIQLLREVSRWRYLLGRHVVSMCDFPSQSTANRRLRALIEGKYLDRQRVLYGFPALYTVTHKGRVLIGANKRTDKVNLALIPHNVAVLDVATYFHVRGIPMSDFVTEKEMHVSDGFSSRRHRPDFLFTRDGERIAVEVELSLKALDKLRSNIQTNFIEYDGQLWLVEKRNSKIARTIIEEIKHYNNIEVLYLNEILENSR